MPAMARLSKKELIELIEEAEAAGNDATELRELLRQVSGEEKPRQPARQRGSRLEEEEESVEDRLNRKVGHLFQDGIHGELLSRIIEMDGEHSQQELRQICLENGLGASGDKKEMAAKLIAHKVDTEAKGQKQGVYGVCQRLELCHTVRASSKKEADPRLDSEEGFMNDKLDLSKQKEWEGKPGEVTIPEAYLKELCHEIVVFTRKERGGSDFTFRCKEYHQSPDGEWQFIGVIIDTSKLNANGDVTLARFTYHPKVVLVNIGFMVVPAPEDAET